LAKEDTDYKEGVVASGCNPFLNEHRAEKFEKGLPEIMEYFVKPMIAPSPSG
jgi:hypothetical protein